MQKERRRKEIRRRKNFFSTLIAIILSWIFVFVIIYFVDPTSFGAVPIFLLSVFIASFLTLATLFANSRRSLTITLALIVFLILRYLGIGNILNLFLILGLAVTIEVYFSKNSP